MILPPPPSPPALRLRKCCAWEVGKLLQGKKGPGLGSPPHVNELQLWDIESRVGVEPGQRAAIWEHLPMSFHARLRLRVYTIL